MVLLGYFLPAVMNIEDNHRGVKEADEELVENTAPEVLTS